MPNNDRKTGTSRSLVGTLRDSGRLRMIVTGCMVALGYLAIYWPLDAAIGETKRRLASEEQRQGLIRDIEQLRGEAVQFKDRLPTQTDTNEWVQYVLAGARTLPLKVTTLDPAERQRVGPYNVVVLHIELEGAFRDLDAFVHWLESNNRLFRVDTVKLSPVRNGSALQMQLTVLGLMG